jgi:hypothetical protein
MNTKLIGTVAAVVLFGLGARAYATTVDLGDISAGDSNGAALFVSTPATSIDDTWSFTLTETLLTAIVIDSADLAPFFGIDGLGAAGSDPAISFAYDIADNAYTFTGVLLGPMTSTSLELRRVCWAVSMMTVGGVTAVPAPARSGCSRARSLKCRATNNA